ncbi:IS21-like element helper ATPase IstB [Nitrobacter sp. TKz-YC01]
MTFGLCARIERHLVEARLPAGKTFDNFDFEAVPMISKAQVTALAAGDGWLGKGANLLLFGPPGGGKSHLAAAIGLALIENGWRVLFTRTTDLVQKLQVARRELNLEAAISRLDRFDLMILDDLAYVTKDQAETSVLFELISARYERRSMLITANQGHADKVRIVAEIATSGDTVCAVARRHGLSPCRFCAASIRRLATEGAIVEACSVRGGAPIAAVLTSSSSSEAWKTDRPGSPCRPARPRSCSSIPSMIVIGGADHQQPACGNHLGACCDIGVFPAKSDIRAPASLARETFKPA